MIDGNFRPRSIADRNFDVIGLGMSFPSLPRSLLLFFLGVAAGTSAAYLFTTFSTDHSRRPVSDDETSMKEDIVDGVEGLIGSTKLVRIRSLSQATGCEILAKAEVRSLYDFC